MMRLVFKEDQVGELSDIFLPPRSEIDQTTEREFPLRIVKIFVVNFLGVANAQSGCRKRRK